MNELPQVTGSNKTYKIIGSESVGTISVDNKETSSGTTSYKGISGFAPFDRQPEYKAVIIINGDIEFYSENPIPSRLRRWLMWVLLGWEWRKLQ